MSAQRATEIGAPSPEQARTEEAKREGEKEREKGRGGRFLRAPVRESHSTQQRKADYECRVRIEMPAFKPLEYFAFDTD